MLSLVELRRVAAVLRETLSQARLRGVAQTDEATVFLRLHVPGGGEGGARHELCLSVRPDTARLSRVEARPPAPAEPPAFAAFLRAHLDRARLGDARLLGDDRQLAVRFETRDAAFDLILSVLGPRSNLYLVDGAGVLRAALRPLADTRRDLALGEPYRAPEGRPPSEGEDRFAEASGIALLSAIEAHFGPAEQAARGREQARGLSQAIGKERARLRRRLAKLEQEAQAGEQAAIHYRHGELLKGVLDRVQPGADAVVAEDFETGEAVTIPLDPKRSAKANLEHVFKRYHKALRQATVAGTQLAEAEERRDFLEALQAEVEAHAEEPEALAAIAERDAVKRMLQRYAPPPPARTRRTGGKDALPRRLQPKRYSASGDLEIWVGRNDEGNDHLTTRLARGKDLFLHLEAEPGSHVILRTGGRSDPPQEALLEACELAVHFSKQRKASRANVHVVPIKNVKKPKGAKPGLVYVTGGKTVHLRRDPARLARVLEGLIPEG